MKIVTWNCYQKFRELYNEIIKEDADIYVIQECEDPEVSKSEEYKKFASNYYWVGENKQKGLGIFAGDDVKIELVDLDDNGLRYFIPVRVNDEFNLLCVWTNPVAKNQVPEYPNEITRYYEEHRDSGFFNSEMIICGDFNCDVSLSNKTHGRNVHKMIEKLSEIGLVDTYHYLNDEKQGEESQPTFYWLFKLENPFHLDHVFAAPDRVKKFEIGDSEKWLGLSDHMPITFEIE